MATGKALCKIRCLLAAAVCAAVFGHVCAVTPFPKVSSPRALTTGPHEHFIANYFGLDAWSPNQRYMVALETDLNGRLPEAGERCTLGVIDLEDANRFIPVTTTACWNFQEAAMAFWIDDDTILFNDVREGRFRTVVMNWRTKQELRVLPMPVSAVSEDRTWAVCINYARLSLTRPDYGYAGPGQDPLEDVEWPENDGLWTMDLKTGAVKLVLSVAEGRSLMVPTKPVPGKPGHPLAYYCHTVISKDGAKIFFLARSVNWFDRRTHKTSIWETTAFTVNRDGTGLRRCFKDGWAGSHFNWAPDGSHRMIVTAKWNAHLTGEHWSKNMNWQPVEFTVGEEEKVRHIGMGFADKDWHCTYSPDGKFMSGETYWDREHGRFERPWVLIRLEDDAILPIREFFVPEKYRGTHWRCDLHARWRKDGRQLAFNSVHEGSRQIYVMDVTPATEASAPSVAGRMPLEGLWDFRLERGKTLEELSLPDFSPVEKMVVPGCWDALSHHWNERGTGLYRRTFKLEGDVPAAYLVIDGMCLRAKAFLDGRELGTRVTPWMRIEFATGALAAGTHELTLAIDSTVDEPRRTRLFRNAYDFYPNGGIHHGVWLETLASPDAIRRVVVRTRDYRTGEIELQLVVAGGAMAADGEYPVAFDGAAARMVGFRNGCARVKVPEYRLWSPEEPNLHRVEVAGVGARFGIRQVGTANRRITLNGKPIYLKGVCRHEMHYEFGSTTPKQLMYEDLMNLKDLGGNFVRGVHYPQCEAFLDLCDELGFLVWEESLGWGNDAKQMGDPEFVRLQEQITRQTVRESINHPSIIISGFLNEPHSGTKEALALVNRLVDVVKAEDSGHLVTFACNRTETDISHVKTDIIAYNTYPCWYNDEMSEGTPEEMRANIRRCHDRITKYFRDRYRDDRPIVVSEIGVKADYGVRDPRGRAQYTEDGQAEYTRIMLEEMMANRDIAGFSIWQFTDCKTYTRTRGMRNRSYGVNTGGLYDLYRRPKMAVEEVRKAFATGQDLASPSDREAARDRRSAER